MQREFFTYAEENTADMPQKVRIFSGTTLSLSLSAAASAMSCNLYPHLEQQWGRAAAKKSKWGKKDEK